MVYLWCLPRSLLRAWLEHARREQPDRDHLDPDAAAVGTPDEDVSTLLDASAHLATRWAAIRAHRAQTSPDEGLPGHLQHAFLATDRLRRVVPAWTGGGVERRLGPLGGCDDGQAGATDAHRVP